MEKQNLWFVAIVAIVAVVGIVLMVSYGGGKAVTVGEGDLAGEAISPVEEAISPLACKDECQYSGQHGCAGDYRIVCGNYDGDSCLEWKKGSLCQYGCQNGACVNRI